MIRYDARGHGASTGAADAAVYRWPELAGRSPRPRRPARPRPLRRGRRLDGHGRLAQRRGRRAGARPRARPHDPADRVGDARRAIGQVPGERGPREAGRIDALVAAELASPPIPIFEGLFDREEMARARADALDLRVVPSILRGAAASDLPEPAAVAKLPQPVLILAWRGDEGHPLSSAEALARLLPQAELLVAERLADLAAWPKRVARFLDELGARSLSEIVPASRGYRSYVLCVLFVVYVFNFVDRQILSILRRCRSGRVRPLGHADRPPDRVRVRGLLHRRRHSDRALGRLRRRAARSSRSRSRCGAR